MDFPRLGRERRRVNNHIGPLPLQRKRDLREPQVEADTTSDFAYGAWVRGLDGVAGLDDIGFPHLRPIVDLEVEEVQLLIPVDQLAVGGDPDEGVLDAGAGGVVGGLVDADGDGEGVLFC